MSADNFWHITRHPEGGYTYCMGFASDENPPELHPDQEYPRFDTVAEALIASDADGWTEYGSSIDPDIEADERYGRDYKDLLTRYIDHVRYMEGTSFLDVGSHFITDDERALLGDLV